MKILKEGKKYEWWVGKIGTCISCDTTIAFEEGDRVSINISTSGDPRESDTAYQECPVCHKSNIGVSAWSRDYTEPQRE